MIEKYKLHEVAKDFNINSKDLITMLQDKFGGEARKSQTVLPEGELNYVFETFSHKGEVKNFDEYFKMKENKPAPKPEVKEEPKTEAKPVVEVKPAASVAPAVEVKPAQQETPRPQQAEEPKPQPKAEPAPQQTPAPAARPAAQPRPADSRPSSDRPQYNNNNNRPQNGGFNRDNRPGGFNRDNRDNRGNYDNRGGFNRAPGNRPDVRASNGFRPNLNQKPVGSATSPARPGQPARTQEPRRPIEIKAPQPKAKSPKTPNVAGNAPHTVVRTTVDMRNIEVNLDKYNERYEQIAPVNGMRDTAPKKQKFTNRNSRRKPVLSRKEREEEKMRRLEMERQRRQRLEVALPEEMTVGGLALMLKIQASEIVKKLMGLGIMASISDTIDYDTASLVAMDIGAKVTKQVVVTIEDRLFETEDEDDGQMVSRPPIVVVMGHVDHGKTSILDAIRKTSVATGEAGGITQHIGAYQVKIKDRPITFLDTPGHAAFTAMRARGAQVTDIAVLVVAADDGIMPQTIEAINHAKAAGVSIIVAINKMDKPHADPDRVKQQLTEYELVPEEWGGETICVPVSAKTGKGLDDLLEMILLVADTKELKANPDRMAKGTVIEAKLDTGRGPIASVLIQSGTLHTGDVIIAGTAVGRVRIMQNDHGQKVDEAGPSCPVEITGLAEVPEAGDIFNSVEDERLARELVEKRRMEQKEEQFKQYQKVTLDNLFEHISEGEVLELPVIIKGDVQGSVEAVRQSLEKLSNDEVRVRVIHGAVGAVSESDVMLAAASHAIIVGFNVRPDPTAKQNAERDGVEIHLYRIIYDAIEEIQAAMKGMLAPKTKEVDLGRAEVRNVYKITGVGVVAGCYVLEGKITRGANIRVVRDGIVIADDKLASLKRFKDDVKEVAQNYECGMSLEKFSDIKNGDVFEAYEIQEVTE